MQFGGAQVFKLFSHEISAHEFRCFGRKPAGPSVGKSNMMPVVPAFQELELSSGMKRFLEARLVRFTVPFPGNNFLLNYNPGFCGPVSSNIDKKRYEKHQSENSGHDHCPYGKRTFNKEARTGGEPEQHEKDSKRYGACFPRYIVMPEEQRFQNTFFLGYFYSVYASLARVLEVLLEINVVRNVILRFSVIQNGASDIAGQKIRVAGIVEEPSVAYSAVSDDSFETHGGLQIDAAGGLLVGRRELIRFSEKFISLFKERCYFGTRERILISGECEYGWKDNDKHSC